MVSNNSFQSLNVARPLPWDGCKVHITSPGFPARLADFLHCLFHPYNLWGGILSTSEKCKTRKLKSMAEISQETAELRLKCRTGLRASFFNQWICPGEVYGPNIRGQREWRHSGWCWPRTRKASHISADTSPGGWHLSPGPSHLSKTFSKTHGNWLPPWDEAGGT